MRYEVCDDEIAGQWRGLKVAIKTVVFQSDLVDGPISRVASETVIASNLIHQNIVATYSHDISAVSKAGDGEPELGVYKFYLIQVRFGQPFHVLYVYMLFLPFLFLWHLVLSLRELAFGFRCPFLTFWP